MCVCVCVVEEGGKEDIEERMVCLGEREERKRRVEKRGKGEHLEWRERRGGKIQVCYGREEEEDEEDEASDY